MSVLSDIQKRHKAYLEGDDDELRRLSKNLMGWMQEFARESLKDGLSEDAIIETLEEREAEATAMLKALVDADEDAEARERIGKGCGQPHGKKKRKARMFADVYKDMSAAQGRKVHAVMSEFKDGTLTTRGKHGKKRRVRDRDQAIAIALSEARRIGKGEDFEIEVPFAKTDDELRVVYGWASVTKIGGEEVVDNQDDVIDTHDLVKAVHDFMLDSRVGGIMHMRGEDGPVVIGSVIESIVLTDDVQKTLGIDLGMEGWFIGIKVMNDTVWKMVKDGRLKAFSIGGKGVRVPVEG
jgi:hypothetical protein